MAPDLDRSVPRNTIGHRERERVCNERYGPEAKGVALNEERRGNLGFMRAATFASGGEEVGKQRTAGEKVRREDPPVAGRSGGGGAEVGDVSADGGERAVKLGGRSFLSTVAHETSPRVGLGGEYGGPGSALHDTSACMGDPLGDSHPRVGA
jgi:hypothetical protein